MSVFSAKTSAFEEGFEVIHPFTGKVVERVPTWSEPQIQTALEKSFHHRCALAAGERAAVLEKAAKKLMEGREGLACLISSESGLALQDTRHEVERAAGCARYAAEVAQTIERDTSGDYELLPQAAGPKLKVVTEALDLAVGITPFNHPLNQVAHKVFPAVAAGTCLVLKPSSQTPLSALRLRALLLECGLEAEMFQVVTGVPAEKIVGALVRHPQVEWVTFTGGLAAGKWIAQAIAGSPHPFKRFVPELGGCSSLIVHEDADLGRAVEVAATGCFANSGQRCTAIRRIVAVGRIADPFVEALAARTQGIRYGDPLDPEMEMGTLISETAARQVGERVEAAIRDGARLLVGNIRKGALYSPTLLDHVRLESDLVAEETFGPVAPVIRVRDIQEAIRVARQTPYRLAGAIMTRDGDLARQVADALAVGQFNWNGPPSYRTEAAPFGGFGDSGNGMKEGVVLAAQGMRRIRTFYGH